MPNQITTTRNTSKKGCELADQLLKDPLVVARFWSKVDVRRPGECWEWRAAKNDLGYGHFRIASGIQTMKAHRAALKIVGTQLADNDIVRHACDNPPCCNPGHLLVGTQAENIADMHARGRRTYKTRIGATGRLRAIEMATAGAKQKDIASELGCSPSYVSMVLSGRRGQSFTKEMI